MGLKLKIAFKSKFEMCDFQVVCHGLSLPFSEHDIIKDCVSIYCEWLSCLAPVPKISVPKPIADRPNFYARIMINHFYHLFSPRKGEGKTSIPICKVSCPDYIINFGAIIPA